MLRTALASVFCLSFGWAAPVSAQSTAQFPVQFDFLNPGARSMALGGAFIAVADDASAAFTNPAGLAFMERRVEVSIEGRFRSMDTPYLASGRISGATTGIGFDTVPGPIYRTDTDSRFGPTFVSLIVPLKTKAIMTAYRHEVTAVTNTFFYEGVYQRMEFAGTVSDEGRDIPLGGTRRVRIANYGASVGFPIVEDKFALGGGLSVYTLNLDSAFTRHGFATDIYGPPDTRLISATATQTAGDMSVGGNAGALWWPTPAWRIGLTYRRGPRFNFDQEDRLQALDRVVNRSGTFKVPDVLGAGVSWRIINRGTGVLRALVDYNRVQYAQLKRDFIDFQAIASDRQEQLRLDNGNELHAGAEYRMLAFRGKTLQPEIVLRGGMWLDPDHTVRYVPNPVPDAIDTLLSATLPGASTAVHYTFGGGLNWGSRVSVNVAADLSARAKYATISAEVAFPRK